MLDKLLGTFIAERTTLGKEEMNSKHAYDMLTQDFKAQIAQVAQDRDEKAEFKAETLQSKADAQGDLQDTTSTRDADQKYLALTSDLASSCVVRAVNMAEGLEDTKDDLAADKKFLAELQKGGSTKEVEWAERCKIRSEDRRVD